MDKKDNNKKQHNRYNKYTAEKIKNMASEAANNSTGIISPIEGKNILMEKEISKMISCCVVYFIDDRKRYYVMDNLYNSL